MRVKDTSVQVRGHRVLNKIIQRPSLLGRPALGLLNSFFVDQRFDFLLHVRPPSTGPRSLPDFAESTWILWDFSRGSKGFSLKILQARRTDSFWEVLSP